MPGRRAVMVVLAPVLEPMLAMDGSLMDQSQEVPPVLALPKALKVTCCLRPSARFREVMVLVVPSTVRWMVRPETITFTSAGPADSTRSFPAGSLGMAVMVVSPGPTDVMVA